MERVNICIDSLDLHHSLEACYLFHSDLPFLKISYLTHLLLPQVHVYHSFLSSFSSTTKFNSIHLSVNRDNDFPFHYITAAVKGHFAHI